MKKYYLTMAAFSIMTGFNSMAAPTVLKCDISNIQLRFRQTFELSFENNEARISGYTLLCDTYPCISSNAILPTDQPLKLAFIATMNDKIFQRTGTNQATVMTGTLTPNGASYLLSTSGPGVPGNQDTPINYNGSCVLEIGEIK